MLTIPSKRLRCQAGRLVKLARTAGVGPARGGGLDPLEDRRDALAAADAHGGQRVPATGALELVERLDGQDRPGRGDLVQHAPAEHQPSGAVNQLVQGISRGLTVDGANNGISACAPDLEGITFQNASGSIERAAIRNFKLSAGLGGCQSGTGLFVQSGGGRLSRVEIEDCTIHDFQKNGITANEIGTTTFIRRNVVTGTGATGAIAQNGVQIGFGAGGEISRNVVTNNLFSNCTAVETCQSIATNILVTQSDGVEVSGNRAGINQVAIFVDGNHAQIERNQTFATSVFDGIRVEGNQAEVRRNRVFNGAEAGIFVMGNNNVLEGNVITEAAIGILKETGSVGNLVAMNRFFDTPIAVQDPTSVGLTKKIQPQR